MRYAGALTNESVDCILAFTFADAPAYFSISFSVFRWLRSGAASASVVANIAVGRRHARQLRFDPIANAPTRDMAWPSGQSVITWDMYGMRHLYKERNRQFVTTTHGAGVVQALIRRHLPFSSVHCNGESRTIHFDIVDQLANNPVVELAPKQLVIRRVASHLRKIVIKNG